MNKMEKYIETKREQRGEILKYFKNIVDLNVEGFNKKGTINEIQGWGKDNYTNKVTIEEYNLKIYQWIDVENTKTNKWYRIFLQTFNEKHLISNLDKITILKADTKDELDKKIGNIEYKDSIIETDISLPMNTYKLELLKNILVGNIEIENNTSDENEKYLEARNNYFQEIEDAKQLYEKKYNAVTKYDSFKVDLGNENVDIYLCSYDEDTNHNSKNKHILPGRITVVKKDTEMEALYNTCTDVDLPLYVVDEKRINQIKTKINQLEINEIKE